MSTESYQAGPLRFGPGARCLIIAEAGVNHNGSMEMARRLVDVAVDIGADIVKFQAWKTEKLVTASAEMAGYQKENLGTNQTQFSMLKNLELGEPALREIQAYCASRGILFLATPFDEESVDVLAELGVPMFKIPSGELTNLNYLARIARHRRPVVLSTGMADLAEVAEAVQTLRGAGAGQIILLQCTSDYPADPAHANLRAMQTMAEEFGLPVGYSDHTPGIEVALAAVALGACVIEKHLTLDRNLPGPDHLASSEPAEMRALVAGIRKVESALGDGRKAPAPGENLTAAVARKSLVAARDLPMGTVLTADMLLAIRPGTGLSPALLPQLIGRKLRQDIPAHTALSFDILQ